jgi:hypothetical protein
MSSHLSPEQVAKWIIGERTSPEEQHVLECPQCHAEVARFQAELAEFGSAVRDWSERHTVVKPARNGRYARPLRWAWLAAAAIVLSSVPAYLSARHRQAEQTRADAVLMEQIDANVSRAIAAPMEPLARLMTWDGKQ